MSKRAAGGRKLTEAQILLRTHLREIFRPDRVVVEYPFILGRRFRLDVAVPMRRLGFECDGGYWGRGHRHGLAIEKDYEKQNLSLFHHWRVFRFTNRQVLNGDAKLWIEEHLR